LFLKGLSESKIKTILKPFSFKKCDSLNSEKKNNKVSLHRLAAQKKGK